MAAGFVLGLLLDDFVLAQFYLHTERARAIIVADTGLIGAAIRALVLAAFRKSERVRRDVAERVATALHPALPELDAAALIGNIGVASRSDAVQTLGACECHGARRQLSLFQAGLFLERRHQRLHRGSMLGRCGIVSHV